VPSTIHQKSRIFVRVNFEFFPCDFLQMALQRSCCCCCCQWTQCGTKI